MASEQMSRLRSLAKKMPATDAKAATRASEAQATQFQAGLAAAPKGQVTQQAQQAGAALTQAQGATAAQQAAKSGAKQQQLGQAALQEQKFQGSQELAKLEREQGLALGNAARQQAVAGQEADIIARKQITTAETEQAKQLQAMGIDQDNRLQTLTLKQREDVSRLGRNVKAELFDNQMQFEKTERGRRFTNDRQLMDYKIATAKSDIELNETLQQMQQDSAKEIMLLEATHAKISQALNQGYLSKEQKLDHAARKKLVEMQEQMRKEIEKKKKKAKNNSMIVKGLSVVGMVVGGIYGGPVGAAAGGAAGSMVGGAIVENT
ncbi:hypothetical protein OAF54_00065 [bacterium]|nr:hypothetical protein [bacterium]